MAQKVIKLSRALLYEAAVPAVRRFHAAGRMEAHEGGRAESTHFGAPASAFQ